jgi:lipopolysaccharide transport system permease protein
MTRIIAASPGPLAYLRFAVFTAGVDIAASFRRTGLGPLWVSLGLALATAAMGLLFGTVLRQQLPDYTIYVPYLAAGMIAWTLLAGILHQTASQTWQFMAQLRHASLPLAANVLRQVLWQLLILAQNILIAVLAQAALLGTVTLTPLPLLGGILLLTANAAWMALLIGLLCARFRDLPQLVAWVVHLAFFLTPILWPVFFLGRFEWLADINPFHQLVELVRRPLLGEAVPQAAWLGGLLLLGLGGGGSLLLYRRLRWRLPYWT